MPYGVVLGPTRSLDHKGRHEQRSGHDAALQEAPSSGRDRSPCRQSGLARPGIVNDGGRVAAEGWLGPGAGKSGDDGVAVEGAGPWLPRARRSPRGCRGSPRISPRWGLRGGANRLKRGSCPGHVEGGPHEPLHVHCSLRQRWSQGGCVQGRHRPRRRHREVGGRPGWTHGDLRLRLARTTCTPSSSCPTTRPPLLSPWR